MKNQKLIDYVQKYIFEINIPIMKVEDIDEKHAKLSMKITDEMCNVYKIAHGGALYSLADTCAGVMSTSLGFSPITMNSSFNFLKACKNGEKVYAISETYHMGKTTGVINVKVVNEKNDLFATGTFTVFNSANYPEKREAK